MKNNEVMVFENEAFGQVRGLTIDGEPWFVGRDVAGVLGYAKPQNALAAHVDEEDRKVAPIQGSPGGTQDMIVINESGLYALILSSKLPKAKEFKRWVTSEVLPSIRKHGAYATPVTIERIIADPDYGIMLLKELKEERKKNSELETTVAVQNQQIAEMQPKVTYYDLVLKCKDALPISIIAKDYGWTAQKMNQVLHKRGIQYKLRRTWLLYSQYADKGYTKSETYPFTDDNGDSHTSINTKWTQKGRLFIYDQLKAEGILPLIEQEAPGQIA